MREQQDYRSRLERGEFAVGYFWGQTRLFVPKTIYEKVGKEKIEQLVREVFTSEEIENFWLDGEKWGEYELSYSIELPSVLTPGSGERNKDQKVSRLIELIRQNPK